MDSPPKFSETLDFIVQFLRAEGFYAAEEALVREIENRCPEDGSSPTASPAHTQLFAPSAGPRGGDGSGDERGEAQPAEAPGQARNGAEAWQQRDEPAGSGSDEPSAPGLHREVSFGRREREALQAEHVSESHAGAEERLARAMREEDEYSDDNDPGYWRVRVRGQDAFLAEQVDLSDEDGSQRGLQLYHQARGEAGPWGRSQDEEDGDGGDGDSSSDGNGSSYFSGEVFERRSSAPLSQVSASDRGAPDEQGSPPKVVTLMEPVGPDACHGAPAAPALVIPPQEPEPQEPAAPAPAAAPPAEAPAAAKAEAPEAAPAAEAAPAETKGPASHPLSHISSDGGADGAGGGLRHEVSLGGGQGLLDTASSGESRAEAGSSHAGGARGYHEGGPEAGQARRDSGWGRGYLDPFGMLGRVFGRSGSRTREDEAEAEAREPALVGAGRGAGAAAAEVVDLQPQISRAPALAAVGAGASDAGSSAVPRTPQPLARAGNGDSDSAFSFPVTPPSEPPAAAAPGAVFGSWPAKQRKHTSKGDLSRASSEYAASGYSTDEGGGGGFWAFDASGESLGGGGGGSQGPKAASDGASGSGTQTPEPDRRSGSGDGGKAGFGSAGSAGLGGKPGLAVGGGGSPGEPGSLQAYKPPPGGASTDRERSGDEQAGARAASSQRDAELTERTIGTGPGGDDSLGGGGGDDSSSVHYAWDEGWVAEQYEQLTLKVIHRRRRTGFEECKDIAIHVNDLIAGRYQVTDFLGSAAFSQAVQALDIRTGQLVCLKIIKNNKDYLDQSLDEIKLLKYVNEADPEDRHGLLRLHDFFYYKEHLFLVCELLRANLYEFQKYNREHGQEPYFTLPRVQSIARQVLRSLVFMHSLDLIHCDLKPENVLIKSYSRCEVKVIDLGSSCFTSDHLSSYVQSRSYRAPEVILGLPYGQSVDCWSLGCILAELLSGYVLFQNDSLATLLARMEGILGSPPDWMLRAGRYAHRYYTRAGALFEQSPSTGRYELLRPKRTSLRRRVPEADEGCLDFLSQLLTIDPKERPTAAQALEHPWLRHEYGDAD